MNTNETRIKLLFARFANKTLVYIRAHSWQKKDGK